MIAVAGDVGGDHGCGSGERLGEHDPKALAAERGSAQNVRQLERSHDHLIPASRAH